MKRVFFLILLSSLIKSDEAIKNDSPTSTKDYLADYLKNLDKNNCMKRDNNNPYHYEYDNVCLVKIEEKFFAFNNLRKHDYSYFVFFRKNVFKPLALRINNKGGMYQLFDDIIKSDQHELLKKENLNTNFDEFYEEILKSFKEIIEKGYDYNTNSEKIKNLIIKILQNFHIYWNSLRIAKLDDRIYPDTKDIVTNLIGQNNVNQKFYFDVTKTLMKKIKQAYNKFLIAHQSLALLKSKGNIIIANQILKRYTNFCEEIKNNNFDYSKFVYELTFNLELTKSYFVFSYHTKTNKAREEIESSFNGEVFNQIKGKFKNYFDDLKSGNDSFIFDNIKNYTATLLLKQKHLVHMTFDLDGIINLVDFKDTEIPVAKNLSVKIYYEILDNMITLPKKCENFENLKNCIYLKVNKLRKYITSKYLLKRSVSGWGVLNYISKMFETIIAADQDIDNFASIDKFKNYFYKKTFSLLFLYKKKYHIKDTQSLDSLEVLLSNTVEQFKNQNGPFDVNFELIDQLDIDLYDELLEIRSTFDDYVPLYQNPQIIEKIVSEFKTFFDRFLEEFKEKKNEKFETLILSLKNDLMEWQKEILKKNSQKINFNKKNIPLLVPSDKFEQTASLNKNSIIINSESRPQEVLKDNKNQFLDLNETETHEELTKEPKISDNDSTEPTSDLIDNIPKYEEGKYKHLIDTKPEDFVQHLNTEYDIGDRKI